MTPRTKFVYVFVTLTSHQQFVLKLGLNAVDTTLFWARVWECCVCVCVCVCVVCVDQFARRGTRWQLALSHVVQSGLLLLTAIPGAISEHASSFFVFQVWLHN